MPAFLLSLNSALYAEDGQSYWLDLDFKQHALYGIDTNKSLQDNEKIYRRNQRYLRDALQSYSKQSLRSIGLSDQTANLVGATIGLVTNGAKLNLNDSKTLAIEFKDVITHDPALYFGYSHPW
jgi:hypothetical protein